jgi:hypothetical protein
MALATTKKQDRGNRDDTEQYVDDPETPFCRS